MQNLVELRPLLADGDEEANFFYNAFHIQLHRRIRAFQRLGTLAQQGAFSNGSATEYLVPLLEYTLSEGLQAKIDHNLVTEVISAIGRVSSRLRWGSYYGLLNKFLRQVKDRSSEEKPIVRVVLAILENFPFDLDSGADSASEEQEAIRKQVTKALVPTLLEHLDQDPNSEDSVRLPIAMGVVFAVRKLPSSERSRIITKLFRALANISKAKAQETRDLAREMLLKVAAALGNEHIDTLVRELCSSLTRGMQKATLALLCHSILVQLDHHADETPVLLKASLVEALSQVAVEDLFGQVAEDRITAAGKHKAREMKSTKSLDAIQLLGKHSTPGALRGLFAPLQKLMSKPLPAVSTSLEQVFRRLASGLSTNDSLDNTTLLVTVHALMTQSSSLSRALPEEAAKADVGSAVLRKRKEVEADKSSSRRTYAQYSFYWVTLGAEVLLGALKKYRFNLEEEADKDRLDALVAPTGNLLFATDSAVVQSGLKLLSELTRARLPAFESASGLVIKQSMAVIQRSGGLHSELSQAALKTLTSLLREVRKSKLLDKDLAQLIEWSVADLEEPEVQSAIFAFIRMLLSKRVMSPTIYDLMDKIAQMLVTNQSGQVREVCRSLYLQFLLDYPQGQLRLKNQLSFLASNLSYKFESGRLSVLELLRAVNSKFDKNALRTASDALFAGLIMAVANDESAACRNKAAELAKDMITETDESTQSRNLTLVRGWAVTLRNLVSVASASRSSVWLRRALLALRRHRCSRTREISPRTPLLSWQKLSTPAETLQMRPPKHCGCSSLSAQVLRPHFPHFRNWCNARCGQPSSRRLWRRNES